MSIAPLNSIAAYKAVLNTMIDAVVISNSVGKIVYTNPSVKRMFGYTTEELLGQDIKIFMPAYYKIRHDEYMDRYKATHVPNVIGKGRKVEAMRKNGELLSCWLSLSDFQVDGLLYFNAIFTNISELEAAQQQLRTLNLDLETKIKKRTYQLHNALEEAKQVNEIKSNFLTLASHEFKTPLSTILSSAILIEKYGAKEDTLLPQQKSHIEKIKKSVSILNAIVEQFLDYEKLNKKVINLRIETFNLAEIIQDCIEIVEPQIKQGQRIVLHCQSIKIQSDLNACTHILINLISNAIKYSPEFSTVEITCNQTEDQTVIQITDEGIGIPEEDQNHIFEKFYRASNTNQKGTGVGLYISKKNADILGGDIQFSSGNSSGSTFKFIIPNNYEKV